MGSMALWPPPPMSLADVKALSVLGQGARGVVFHVVPADAGAAAEEGRSSPEGSPMPMALKAMSRAAARRKGREGPGFPDGHRRIWFERDVLLALRHPLLPSLRGVVATDAVVGFAMDRCPGGDLKSLRRRWRAFPESVIRFYAAELVLALEHLHGLGVVYRDLKPENVLIQDSGHIMLIDFDLSTALPAPVEEPDGVASPRPGSGSPSSSRHRLLDNLRKRNKVAAMVLACLSSRQHHDAASSSSSAESPCISSRTSVSSSCCSSPANNKSTSFVGTEDYVAPEIVAGTGHDRAVDWWSLGVVLYEMLYGATPFRGRSRRETFLRVLTAPPELPGERTPLRDLVARLLDKDPATRISARGVRRHAFFRGVDWDRVLDVARPPFIPAAPDDSREAEAEALDVEKVVREAFGSSAAGESETRSAKASREDDGTDDDFSVFF